MLPVILAVEESVVESDSLIVVLTEIEAVLLALDDFVTLAVEEPELDTVSEMEVEAEVDALELMVIEALLDTVDVADDVAELVRVRLADELPV